MEGTPLGWLHTRVYSLLALSAQQPAHEEQGAQPYQEEPALTVPNPVEECRTTPPQPLSSASSLLRAGHVLSLEPQSRYEVPPSRYLKALFPALGPRQTHQPRVLNALRAARDAAQGYDPEPTPPPRYFEFGEGL